MLNVTAGSGNDYIAVNPDGGDPTRLDIDVDLGAGATNNGLDGIELDVKDVEQINIDTGAGADTVVISGDLGGTGVSSSTVTVDGGAGNDTIDASAIVAGVSANQIQNGSFELGVNPGSFQNASTTVSTNITNWTITGASVRLHRDGMGVLRRGEKS